MNKTTPSETIFPLADSRAALETAGGKGASLARLVAAGLPVPGGFHITTPAWTPLFAMAAAVVTDVGGPLSHGSIVAREYGIPAVMGTGIATKRIFNGQVITVDGNEGSVEIQPAPQAA
jgi:phosphoenolpyruvate synthase/pyruvate phosphate dikinase